MKAAILRGVLTKLFDEIQDLRVNQKLLTHALKDAGVKTFPASYSDLLGEFQKEVKLEEFIIRSQIEILGEE